MYQGDELRKRIFKVKIVRWVGTTGERVKARTLGARKVEEESSRYYCDRIPGYPRKKRFPLTTDAETSVRMLKEMLEDAERGKLGYLNRSLTKLPLKDHLDKFKSDFQLGIGIKRSKPPSDEQIELVVARIRNVLDGCKLRYPVDLNPESPAKVSKYLRNRLSLPEKHEDKLSAQSCSFYLAAIRRFARWLAKKGTGVQSDLFDMMAGFDPRNHRVHPRREILPEKFDRLIETAKASSKKVRGLTGPERSLLYLLAATTGYRASELAELVPESFRLDDAPPTVGLPGRLTKNAQRALIPVHSALVEQLREFLRDRPAGRLAAGPRPNAQAGPGESRYSVQGRDARRAEVRRLPQSPTHLLFRAGRCGDRDQRPADARPPLRPDADDRHLLAQSARLARRGRGTTPGAGQRGAVVPGHDPAGGPRGPVHRVRGHRGRAFG